MDVKEIPGTRGFKASINGEIYDSRGKLRNQYINGDGYRTASVLTLSGKWQTFGVHRLVALAHIPFTGNLIELTVNHIDGNIENNNHKNLEWLSVKDNNVHAALLRGSKKRPVILAKRPDGSYEFISNLYTAAKKFNTDISLIWESIRDRKHIDGYLLSHHSTNSLTPKELFKGGRMCNRGIGKIQKRGVDVLDIETQEIEKFESLHLAAVRHNTSPGHVCSSISSDRIKLFKNKYFIVDSGENFPIISQEEYESLLGPNGKEVIAYNTSTKNIHIYPSASLFIKENGLSKKAVTVDLKNKRLRLINNWWFTYYTDENIERLKVVVKFPDLTTKMPVMLKR